MNYVCPDARFYFWNGKTGYTVEYVFGLQKWFVFNEKQQSSAIHIKEDKKTSWKGVNLYSAENILFDFLGI